MPDLKNIVFHEFDSPEVMGLLQAGRDFMEAENFALAVQSFEKILDYQMTQKLACLLYDQLSFCFAKLGDNGKAAHYLEALCDMEFNEDSSIDLKQVFSFKNIFTLLDLYKKMNNEIKKIQLQNKIKKLVPESDNEERQLISMLLDSKDFDEGIKRLREKLENEPGDLAYGKQLLSAYMSKNDLENAHVFANRLVEQGHEDELLGELWELHKKLYDYDAAFVYIKRHLNRLKEQNNLHAYYATLGGLLTSMAYFEPVSDDEYIAMIDEYYYWRLRYMPPKQREFNINTCFFRKIRVGIISYDLRIHPVGQYVSMLFDRLPRNSGVEIYCYHTCLHRDELTAVIEHKADAFKDVSKLSDDRIRQLIYEDRIDVMIDLSGSTLGSKLGMFPLRLAPIQLTWIGFPISTYTPGIDYMIGDYDVDPIDGRTERYLTEKLVRMDNSSWRYIVDIQKPILPPPYKRNGYITFGTVCNPAKYTDKSLRMWGKVLERIPNAILLAAHNIRQNEYAMKRLAERFAQNGIDPSRTIFKRTKSFAEYIDVYYDVDIILDTYPFCALTTTFEALSMGVPTVSFVSGRRESRTSVGVYKHIGLGDLAIETEEAFVEKAVELANDKERLDNLRQTLREEFHNSPICDSLSYRQDFENVIRSVFIEYCTEHKEPFASYYEDMDGLVRSCLLANDYLRYKIKRGEPMLQLELLTAEYMEMLKLLMDNLLSLYEQETGALKLLQRMINNVSLLPTAADHWLLDSTLERIQQDVIDFM